MKIRTAAAALALAIAAPLTLTAAQPAQAATAWTAARPAGNSWYLARTGAAAASTPHTKTVTYQGFNGDDVNVTINWRTASDNGGSVRVVDARLTPIVSTSGQVDRARGFADATVRILTRAGREVRNTGEVGIGGTEGTLFRFGDLIQHNEGAVITVLLDVRGVQQNVRIPLA